MMKTPPSPNFIIDTGPAQIFEHPFMSFKERLHQRENDWTKQMFRNYKNERIYNREINFENKEKINISNSISNLISPMKKAERT